MLKKVKTSLLEMAYEEKGDASGKPIILMHGFPDDAKTWNPVPGAVVEAVLKLTESKRQTKAETA